MIVACNLYRPYPSGSAPIVRFYVDVGRRRPTSEKLIALCDRARILCDEYGKNYRYHTFERVDPAAIDPSIPLARITENDNVAFYRYARPVDIGPPLESYAVVDSERHLVAVIIDAVPVRTAGFTVGRMAHELDCVAGIDSVGFPVFLWDRLPWPDHRDNVPRLHIDDVLNRLGLDRSCLIPGEPSC